MIELKQSEYTFACAQRLRAQGYGEVEIKSDEAVTAVDPEGCTVCFRCVLAGWSRVGEFEVEETISMIRYYGSDRGEVLTNGRFTLGARLRAKQEGNIALTARYLVRSDRREDYDALL